MEQFLLYHRRMFFIVLIVSGIVACSLFLILPSEPTYALGFVAGAAAQLVKFGFLDVATVRNIAANPKGGAKVQLQAMVMTMIIFSIAIVVSLKVDFNVWTMAAGVFLPRIILLADTFLRPDPFSSRENRDASRQNNDSDRDDA